MIAAIVLEIIVDWRDDLSEQAKNITEKQLLGTNDFWVFGYMAWPPVLCGME